MLSFVHAHLQRGLCSLPNHKEFLKSGDAILMITGSSSGGGVAHTRGYLIGKQYLNPKFSVLIHLYPISIDDDSKLHFKLVENESCDCCDAPEFRFLTSWSLCDWLLEKSQDHSWTWTWSILDENVNPDNPQLNDVICHKRTDAAFQGTLYPCKLDPLALAASVSVAATEAAPAAECADDDESL